jgi:riboflavin-specific deaminase-like protein
MVDMQMVFGPRIGPVGSGGLAAAYTWPTASFWLRVMMVMTLDGAIAGADGRSGSISSVADRAVLSEVRRLSDAILVGATTVRAEPYKPVRGRPEFAAERKSEGLAPSPVLVVVSASLDLPWDAPMFGESSIRPLVVTTESVSEKARRNARKHADLLVLPGDRLEPRVLVDELSTAGLRRVVCEGGPGLVSTMAAGSVIDEVNLSISPLLCGGSHPGQSPSFPNPARFELRHIVTDGKFLFNRYVSLDRAEFGEPA